MPKLNSAYRVLFNAFMIHSMNFLSVKKQKLQHSNIAWFASQKPHCFRLFMTIFYDTIDGLNLFSLYTKLREMISYIYANPFRKSWLPYLEEL